MSHGDTVAGIMGFIEKMGGLDGQAIQEALTVRKVHRRVERSVDEYLSVGGLNCTQVDVLEALYFDHRGAMTPAELAEEIDLTRSAMTSALDTLEKPGYIARSPHPTDRRMVAVSLTAEGRAFTGDRLEQRYRLMGRIVCELSADERMALRAIYEKIRDLLAAAIGEEEK